MYYLLLFACAMSLVQYTSYMVYLFAFIFKMVFVLDYVHLDQFINREQSKKAMYTKTNEFDIQNCNL